MNPPAKLPQHLFSESISISCAVACAVSRAVTFNRQEVTARIDRVNDGHVNRINAATYFGDNAIVHTTDFRSHSILKSRIKLAQLLLLLRAIAAFFSVLQVTMQSQHSRSARSVNFNIRRFY